MLRAGDCFSAGKQTATVCAFVPRGRDFAGVTAAHVFRYAGTDKLSVGPYEARVFKVQKEYDLAYFSVPEAEATPLGVPDYGEAEILSSPGVRPCRVCDLSWSLAMVVLQPAHLPGPGWSGSPVFQRGKMVGMLSSINLNTCKGTVVSADLIGEGCGR